MFHSKEGRSAPIANNVNNNFVFIVLEGIRGIKFLSSAVLLGVFLVLNIPSSVCGQMVWNWQHPWPQGSDINAVDFIGSETGYTVGQTGTINRTTDGGVTWLHCKSGTVNDLFGLSFSDASHGTAVGRVGTILRTTDGGVSWTSQTSGTSGLFRAVSFVNPQSGTAVGINGIIYHTTNGGFNWYPQTSGTTTHLYGVSHTAPGHWIAVGAGGLILYSGNDGATWSPQTSTTTNQLTNVFFVNSTVGWAVGINGTILHTTDEGLTWTPQSSGTTNHLYAVSFSDVNNGVVAGLNGVVRVTTDGGGTWSARTSGTTNHLYGVSCGDGQHCSAVGRWGEILATTDGGTTWLKQQRGVRRNLHGVAFKDSLVGFAVGDSGTILGTTDGGISWDPAYSGTVYNLSDIQFVDTSFGIIVGDAGTILKTTDGGASWDPRPCPVNNPLTAVSVYDGQFGTIVGVSSCPILFTTDGGESWNTKYNYTFPDYDVQMLNGSIGWFCGRAYLYVTTAGWDSVTIRPVFLQHALRGIHFRDWSTGTLVGDLGQIFQTTDGSNTFQSRSSGVTTQLNKVTYSDDSTGIIVGDEGVILVSSDRGIHWSPVVSGTIDHLDNLFFVNDHSGWVVGNRGTILHLEQPAGDSPAKISVNAKWNMVSVPYRVDDYFKSTLFPTAISDAFSFDDGYLTDDTLKNGLGYWLKFPEAQTITMNGGALEAETVDVNTGWNMVGSLSTVINASDIGSIPGGIVTSGFYQFDGSYTQSPVILPGKGYWVKASQQGKLIFTTTGLSTVAARIRIHDTGELPPEPPEMEDHISGSVPRQFDLFQNSPNPFNPSTEITYTLPVRSRVRLVVYDLLGRRVSTLIDGEENPGVHSLRWKSGAVPSGVYFYRLLAGGYAKTMKMVVLR